MTSWRGPQQYSTVQYSNCGRVSQTSALASERSLFMRVPRGPSNVPQSLRSGKAILSGGDGWLGGDLLNHHQASRHHPDSQEVCWKGGRSAVRANYYRYVGLWFL
jgi:hypothetical protein